MPQCFSGTVVFVWGGGDMRYIFFIKGSDALPYDTPSIFRRRPHYVNWYAHSLAHTRSFRTNVWAKWQLAKQVKSSMKINMNSRSAGARCPSATLPATRVHVPRQPSTHRSGESCQSARRDVMSHGVGGQNGSPNGLAWAASGTELPLRGWSQICLVEFWKLDFFLVTKKDSIEPSVCVCVCVFSDNFGMLVMIK